MWFNLEKSFANEMLQFYALVLEIIKGKSVFYYNPSGTECNWNYLQEHNLTSQPQWAWHSPVPYLQLKEKHNDKIFVLVCLKEHYEMKDLQGLPASLVHLRHVKILIEFTESNSSEKFRAKKLLSYFLQHKMLNVALYFQSSKNHLKLYSFQAFPEFKLLQHNLSSLIGTDLYPNQIRNLGGYTFSVLPDFSEPSTIKYTDANGKQELGGFIWHFIVSFVAKINANLKVIYPTWTRGRHLSEMNMLKMTKNGTLDVGLFTAALSRINYEKFRQYSYPVIQGDWCLMLPLERPIEIPQIFGHILRTGSFTLVMIVLIIYWLLFPIIKCSWRLSWLRNLRFPFLTCLRYWRLSFRVIFRFLICSTQAQLLFLLILNPREDQIENFDDLLASDLRICAVNSEFYYLEGEFRAKYAALFRLTNDVNEFFELRNSFNTSFAYSIPYSKWQILETQQRNFQRSVFRYSELCLQETIPYSLVLDEDSLFYEAIMLYTLRIYQAGLMDYWQTLSFYDMIKAGRMHFRDYSVAIQPRPLRLLDFQIPCCYFGLGILLAFSLFAIELLRFYTKVFLDNL